MYQWSVYNLLEFRKNWKEYCLCQEYVLDNACYAVIPSPVKPIPRLHDCNEMGGQLLHAKDIIVWQRNWPDVRCDKCRSVFSVLLDISFGYTVNHWAAHCMGIVNWYWLLMQPFVRQAVCWGLFISNSLQLYAQPCHEYNSWIQHMYVDFKSFIRNTLGWEL